MPRVTKIGHKKRYGQHHKRSHRYAKVYAPYLPLIISLIGSIFLSFWQPAPGSTLAYATEMSAGGLLSATNSHRANSGKAALALNQKLINAAQAKANDMIARNYWSHTTPDGQQPWVFIDNTGYKYSKAGENLAYGFATSSDAVTGWMNSPAHKDNMLDGTFTEVGFGYANGSNYNSSGEQTVVVAMYAKPQTLAATTPAPTAPAPSTPKPAPAPAPTPTPEPAPTPAPTEQAEPEPIPVTTEQPVADAFPTTHEIAQVQTLTGGRAPWTYAATATALGILMIFWMLHHSLRLRHLLKEGGHILKSSERLVLHHPLLDVTLLSLTIFGLLLSRTVGYIL